MSPNVVLLALLAVSSTAGAQTDYYNTDARRPLRVEDAYALEHRAIEIQAAPLRIERGRNGYTWSIEPELSWGLLPRTHVEIGVPLTIRDRTRSALDAGAPTSARTVRTRIDAVELSALYNFNVETRLPALALRVDAHLLARPVTSAQRFDRVYPTVTAIGTKTFTWARFHANFGVTLGDDPTAVEASLRAFPGTGMLSASMLDDDIPDVSRVSAGFAVDRTFPLHSLLIGAELFASVPIGTDDVEVNAGIGSRLQLSPRVALDGGLGRRMNGAERAWYLTAGGAVSVGSAFGLGGRR